ncbi:uncharacterized protein LOC131993970 [Stomoxys calcitrans]|uniref:uncharacterized protein LOC131993970 n=1 Tax=Stomoxys calcitrans TaxID=35570 RepID=UPI0027E33034|nr:uncharacterized protein LOC131993970 [Stomoxys calcitrans]
MLRNLLFSTHGNYKKAQHLLARNKCWAKFTGTIGTQVVFSKSHQIAANPKIIQQQLSPTVLLTRYNFGTSPNLEGYNSKSTLQSYGLPYNSNFNNNILAKSISAHSLRSLAEIPEKRKYCTKTDGTSQPALSKREQLKKAFKDYGSTIVIFHVGISLISLGGFYILVSSGIDVIAMIEKTGFAPSALSNNVAIAGASNFVIAYAIHKIFAPVRISITLGATPFIVRFLRSKGVLKTVVSSKAKAK